MAGYMMVPAPPGTFLIEGTIEHKEGSEPEFSRHIIIGWKSETGELHENYAVAIGHSDVETLLLDGYVKDEMSDSYSISMGVEMPDGSVAYRDKILSARSFTEFVAVDLLNRRDQILSIKQESDRGSA